jgi:hypothetical protein
LNFLVDAQLPPALARWISGRGHEAIHVFDIALLKATDPDIWEHARQQNAVIICKDEDFVDRWWPKSVKPEARNRANANRSRAASFSGCGSHCEHLRGISAAA